MSSTLLAGFLGHPDRGLSEPDGRPLYAYRCRRSELRLFEQHLKMVLRPGSRPDPITAQLFCLWAAEWWRRNHTGGHWSWDDLLAAVEAQHLAPGHPGYRQLCRMVATGLRRWKRDLLRTAHGRAFLVTLACEGGLPLQLVKHKGASLRRYFKALLEEFRLFGSKTPPEVLAERVRYRLPKSLQRDVVFELSGKLVEEIWELQNELGDTDTPLRDLERWDSNWRDRLPLRIEAGVARALLNNLLLDAVDVARGRGTGVAWRRWLERTDMDRWRLRAELDLPSTMELDAFAGLFDMEIDEIPKRFELRLSSEAGSLSLIAIGATRLYGDERRVVLEHSASANDIIRGRAATEARAIVLFHSSESVTTNDFDGSDELSDLPWVFKPPPEDDEGGRYELLSEGSAKLASSFGCVASPRQCVPSAERDGIAQLVGDVEGIDRRVYRLEGDVGFDLPDGMRVTVRTGRAEGRRERYRFVGEGRRFGVDSKQVFLGAPQLVRKLETGPPRRIRTDRLMWKPAHPEGSWGELNDRAVGDGRVRYVEAGRVLFSSRLSVLPRRCSIQYLPGQDEHEGVIEISGVDADDVAVLSGERGEIQVDPEFREDGLSIRMSAKHQRPPSVELMLRWRHRGQLKLELPFPALSCGFLRPDGSRVPPEATIAVGRAAGHRARVVVPRRATEVCVDCLYRGTDVTSLPRQLTFFRRRMETVSDGLHELDLGSIQSAARHRLRLSDDASSIVRVQPQSNDIPELPQRRVQLARFDLELTREGDEVIRLTEQSLLSLEPEELERLECQAVPFSKPLDDPQPLDRLRPAAWVLPQSPGTHAHWMVVLLEGSVCRAVPLFVSIGENSVEQPSGAAESPFFSVTSEELMEDPSHPDWDRLTGMIHWGAQIPAVALPDYGRLVSSPGLIATAALQASESTFQVLWREAETMPFWWPLVSRAAWETSAEAFLAGLRDEYSALGPSEVDQEAFVRQRFDKAVERVTSELSWLRPVFAFLRSRLFSARIDPEMSRVATPKGAELLRRQHRAALTEGPVATASLSEIPDLEGAVWFLRRIGSKAEDEPLIVPREGRFSEMGRWVFANAPALAAYSAMHGIDLNRSQLCAVLGMRAFDPDWFDDLFGLAHRFFFGTYKRRRFQHE